MNIRTAKKEDALGIAQVHVTSWKETYRGIMNQAYLDSLNINDRLLLWENSLSNPSEDAPVIVAENENGQIVGFASFGKERTEKYGIDGELYAIYLLDDYKGKKIGTQLFYAGIEKMKNISSILLWVISDNPSKKFYESFHPEKVGEDIFEINGKQHEEIAYAWKNIDFLRNSLRKAIDKENGDHQSA